MTFDPQQLMIFYIANQVISALVQALPAPNGNVLYGFGYKFLNLLTADFKTFSAQIPQPVLVDMTSTGKIVTTETPSKSVEKS